MGAIFSFAEYDTKNLVGQTVMSVESLAGHGSVCVLKTESGDVYAGPWTDGTRQAVHLPRNEDGKFAPFVVSDVYRDRHGLYDLFATRCWVLVAADGRRYELHVRSLDLFADVRFEDA